MLCKRFAGAVVFCLFGTIFSSRVVTVNPTRTLAQRDSSALSPSSPLPLPDANAATDHKSINPGLDTLLTHVKRVPQEKTRYITNAERLRRGLPLNPPVRRTLRPPGSRNQPQFPKPSQVPGRLQNGFIEVYDDSSDSLIGFVGRSFNEFGEYTVTTNLGDALAVQLDTDKATSGFTNIVTTNGPDNAYPFFGAITGFGNDSPDLGPGQFEYVYLGGVVESALSLPAIAGNTFTSSTNLPQRIESAIWAYSPSNGEITAQWTNTDSSVPKVFAGIVRENRQEILMYTGDPNAFRDEFLPVQLIKFKFIPTS